MRFLSTKFEPRSFDRMIINPPFRLGEEFVLQALNIAGEGVAISARTVSIEIVGRYQKSFTECHPRSSHNSLKGCR
jgi:16S rRNA G1207 methylase RsmC